MGLLLSLVSKESNGSSADAKILVELMYAIAGIDGKVEPSEEVMIEAHCQTLPQVKSKTMSKPAKLDRRDVLAALEKVIDERLRKQCFVLAVEIALASGGVNEPEDQFMEHVRKALRLDDAFARQAVQVVAAKYSL
jgi:tellurite resistance protein